MKILVTVISVFLIQSLAHACPGGDLLQVVAQDGTVIANYKINGPQAGFQLARNKSFVVTSFAELGINNKVTNLCLNRSCTKLKSFDNAEVQVKYDEVLTGKSGVTVIEDVSIGKDVNVAKGEPYPVQKGLQEELKVIECSKR